MRPWFLLTLYLVAVAAVAAIGWTLAARSAGADSRGAARLQTAKYQPFPGPTIIMRLLYRPGMAAKPRRMPMQPLVCPLEMLPRPGAAAPCNELGRLRFGRELHA